MTMLNAELNLKGATVTYCLQPLAARLPKLAEDEAAPTGYTTNTEGNL